MSAGLQPWSSRGCCQAIQLYEELKPRLIRLQQRIADRNHYPIIRELRHEHTQAC